MHISLNQFVTYWACPNICSKVDSDEFVLWFIKTTQNTGNQAFFGIPGTCTFSNLSRYVFPSKYEYMDVPVAGIAVMLSSQFQVLEVLPHQDVVIIVIIM